MKLFYALVFTSLLVGCNSSGKTLSANDIVNKSIAKHCNGNCEKSIITFNFRNRSYKSIKKGGTYQYERIFSDSLDFIRDVLTNDGFKRYVNDTLVALPDAIKTKYTNSVNSVYYFAQLPYGLNAPAANKELLGEATINGKDYYEIGVTFNEEGGGADFEDKFVYWINKTDFSMDYLAYSYAVDGGGIRFREAYNKRVVNGITFLDYNNYKPKNLDVELTDLDALFQNDKLELLSKIETEHVEVILVE
ncbi:deoxyribose-phosphate aldolase [Hyunsoonleella flava]|uniref:Deoxyribose-phosphate aldolase n=1 Tax=Hyunsoonleella flava TaxID=2527939 RepID=A0A4Q9FA77_9FLAO|nr:DUF6503 family protein [Hyunsoonleella flava]TBN00400.1 deoxyribose-phosphate aldolase [Hyunsoonleella flava]